jgi:hypothetical protein
VAKTPNARIKTAAFGPGKFPTIAFVNLAETPLGADLGKLVAALQKQVDRDFVPVWGYPAKLYVTDKPEPDEWQVVFLDDADAANALGYHDLTKDGQPVSKVFVKTTIAAGQKITVTASHELLEMMIDPGAQLWAQSTDGRFYAYEMCDAVEDEEYVIDGISVSDFLYPSFFESWHQPRSVQFDHLKKVSQPFQTLQNGYQIVSDGKTATEIFASFAKWRNFHALEIRTQHRSEYRKLMMPSAYPSAASAGSANTPFGSAHSAMLYHAGQFLTALAAANNSSQFDPFQGWDTPGRARQAGPIRGPQFDPFPGGWHTPGRARQAGPIRGPQFDPFPGGWQTPGPPDWWWSS